MFLKRIVFTFPASQCFTGQGITGNTVWPATVIESQAINFGMMEINDTHTQNSMQHQRKMMKYMHKLRKKVISCHYPNGCSCSCYLHKELMKIQMPFDVSDSQLKNITFGTAEGSCIDPRDPWHRPRRILSLEVARCGARPTFIDFTRFLHSRSFSLHSNRRYFLQKKMRRCCSWKERRLTEFANTTCFDGVQHDQAQILSDCVLGLVSSSETWLNDMLVWRSRTTI